MKLTVLELEQIVMGLEDRATRLHDAGADLNAQGYLDLAARLAEFVEPRRLIDVVELLDA